MARISEGKLINGVVSFSLLDALETLMNPAAMGNGNEFNVLYGTLQMQLDKALGHLEVKHCTYQYLGLCHIAASWRMYSSRK